MPREQPFGSFVAPEPSRQSSDPQPSSNLHFAQYSFWGMFPSVTIHPTDVFAALAHETRLRCLILLMRYPELCVCELTHAIGAVQPHVSRHLAQLRELGLVTDRREGLWIFYRVNPALPDWVAAVLRETFDAMCGERPFVEDDRVLVRMPNRPVVPRCA